MEKLTRKELERLILIGNKVIIKLPAETDDKNRELKSGIIASFIYADKEKYAPVFGHVYKRGKKSQLRDGDHVFFHYLCYDNAKHSFESFNNGHYDGTKMTFECEGEKYLLMEETEIFFAKRGQRYVAMNNNVLLRSIPKDLKEEILRDTKGYQVGRIWVTDATAQIAIADVEEPYRMDIAEVVAAPEGIGVRVGDIIYPDKHWDVPIEYDILETIGEKIYRIHKDVILAKKN
jgi:co-chaperonin GroES (HSP10)